MSSKSILGCGLKTEMLGKTDQEACIDDETRINVSSDELSSELVSARNATLICYLMLPGKIKLISDFYCCFLFASSPGVPLPI